MHAPIGSSTAPPHGCLHPRSNTEPRTVCLTPYSSVEHLMARDNAPEPWPPSFDANYTLSSSCLDNTPVSLAGNGTSLSRLQLLVATSIAEPKADRDYSKRSSSTSSADISPIELPPPKPSAASLRPPVSRQQSRQQATLLLDSIPVEERELPRHSQKYFSSQSCPPAVHVASAHQPPSSPEVDGSSNGYDARRLELRSIEFTLHQIRDEKMVVERQRVYILGREQELIRREKELKMRGLGLAKSLEGEGLDGSFLSYISP